MLPHCEARIELFDPNNQTQQTSTHTNSHTREGAAVTLGGAIRAVAGRDLGMLGRGCQLLSVSVGRKVLDSS